MLRSEAWELNNIILIRFKLSSMRVIIPVRRMVVDEIRPYKIVLLTWVASRGITGLRTSCTRNKCNTRAIGL